MAASDSEIDIESDDLTSLSDQISSESEELSDIPLSLPRSRARARSRGGGVCVLGGSTARGRAARGHGRGQMP